LDIRQRTIFDTPDQNLHGWFENAFVVYALVFYPDSVDVRHSQGLAIAHLAKEQAAAAELDREQPGAGAGD
jgi:hypothetical protein